MTFSNPLAVRHSTLGPINTALRARGIREQVYRGHGYFFFADGRSAEWPSTSVYVAVPEALTIGGWLMEWYALSGRPLPANQYGDHELTDTEYVSEIEGEYVSRWVQGCSCGWRGSPARGRTDAINGGKAHIRAIRKKENV